jgi:hypothetical protein
MKDDSTEVLRFQRCCNLRGEQYAIQVGKRNGRLWASFSQSLVNSDDVEDHRPCLWEQQKLYVNLNRLERQTWEKILQGRPVADIAREEHVSRQAIYARIEGTHGYGGMIGKNFWVLLWWRLRKNK